MRGSSRCSRASLVERESMMVWIPFVMSLVLQQPAAPAAALPPPPPPLRPPARADLLRGEYGRYRANNDLLYYHLDVRIDPEKKSIAGKNAIRFRMLADDTR